MNNWIQEEGQFLRQTTQGRLMVVDPRGGSVALFITAGHDDPIMLAVCASISEARRLGDRTHIALERGEPIRRPT